MYQRGRGTRRGLWYLSRAETYDKFKLQQRHHILALIFSAEICGTYIFTNIRYKNYQLQNKNLLLSELLYHDHHPNNHASLPQFFQYP